MAKLKRKKLKLMCFLAAAAALVGFILLPTLFGTFLKSFTHLNSSKTLISFFEHSPVLRQKLLLIDKNILRAFQDARFGTRKFCVFCEVPIGRPLTFALIAPVNRSLEESILIPILQEWEAGFWVEQIIYTKYNPFSPMRLNLPLGAVLQKHSGTIVIEVVILHQREGDFWWHGSLDRDASINQKLNNLKLMDRRSSLALNKEGAYDKILFEPVHLDGIEVNVPRDIKQFLSSSTTFIECSHEQADKFHRAYGRDASARANMFRHRVRKLLATAKTILDDLKIPFWISSGTLLGYFRQCDVIPYSQDVDIGVFIKNYNVSIIPAFVSHGLKLKHKFGRLNDGFQLSFSLRSIKLDIFFFYEEKNYFWNGGHSLVYQSGKLNSGVKYRYDFPKFKLCWTEFLDMKVRIPCETQAYIEANYGPNWSHPVSKWHWYKDPFNVKQVGVWSTDEVADVLQIF